MNHWFKEYIHDAEQRADSAGVTWRLNLNSDGKISKEQRWDLCAMVRSPPPRIWLSDLGTYEGCLAPLNAQRSAGGLPEVPRQPLSEGWQDLIKATVLDQLLVRGNSPKGLIANIVSPLRILATCAADAEPWDLTSEQVGVACDIAREAWSSGKYAEQVLGAVRDVIDRNHLAERSPLSSSARARRLGRVHADAAPVLRKHLEDRKTPHKLPDEKALWELVRIVFTERPRTFVDVIRFAQCRILLLCGLRIEEVCSLPADWRRTREYFDVAGRPAGEVGGVSRSLMIRHFAEKQRGEGKDGVERHESFQHVPEMFEEIIESTLDQVYSVTQPLRNRLARQIETGRLFPEYAPDDFMPAVEFFCRLLGWLHWRVEPLPAGALEKYQETWDPTLLDALRAQQAKADSPVHPNVKSSWSKLAAREGFPEPLDILGSPWKSQRIPWRETLLRVSDAERFVAEEIPTKLPDRTGLRLANGGVVLPSEMLFVAPKRSLLEERNGGVCDVGLYCSLGCVDSQDLMCHLGSDDVANLFRRYGRTDEDRTLSLNSHSLRHLQNTELFRQGVSDLIITKRFGRKSVPQSYEYDHRSLAEELDGMELPPGAEEVLGEKAQYAFKLIAAAKTAGPLVEEFRRLQREDGDASAFEFLRVEADGVRVLHQQLHGRPLSQAPRVLPGMPTLRALRTSRAPLESCDHPEPAYRRGRHDRAAPFRQHRPREPAATYCGAAEQRCRCSRATPRHEALSRWPRSFGARPMTTRRRASAEDRDHRLRRALEEMFNSGERISARGVLKHLPDLRAPSSVTRDPVRRALLEDFRQRQADQLAWAHRAKKLASARLEAALAARDRRIAELEHQLQILIGSHVALVQAVGELGGLPKWKQAFQGYERCLTELEALGALGAPPRLVKALPVVLGGPARLPRRSSRKAP